jgi:hypothetical protein
MEDMEEITLTGATEGDEASRREKFKGTAVYKALQKFEAREVAAHDVIAALQDESCLPDASLTIHLAAASDDAWARMVLSAEFFLKILQKDPAYEKKATNLEKFGALCERYIPRERNSTIEAMFAVVKKDFLMLREKLQNVTLIEESLNNIVANNFELFDKVIEIKGCIPCLVSSAQVALSVSWERLSRNTKNFIFAYNEFVVHSEHFVELRRNGHSVNCSRPHLKKKELDAKMRGKSKQDIIRMTQTSFESRMRQQQVGAAERAERTTRHHQARIPPKRGLLTQKGNSSRKKQKANERENDMGDIGDIMFEDIASVSDVSALLGEFGDDSGDERMEGESIVTSNKRQWHTLLPERCAVKRFLFFEHRREGAPVPAAALEKRVNGCLEDAGNIDTLDVVEIASQSTYITTNLHDTPHYGRTDPHDVIRRATEQGVRMSGELHKKHCISRGESVDHSLNLR